MPGVVAVFTAADLGLRPFHGMAKVHDHFARPPLATDTVRFVGEAVAVVRRRDRGARPRTPPTLVVVDYDPLPAVVDPEDALADGARRCCSTSTATTWPSPPPTPVQPDIFGDADVVVRGRYVNQRMAVAPMEPHARRRDRGRRRPARWSTAARRCRTCCTACCSGRCGWSADAGAGHHPARRRRVRRQGRHVPRAAGGRGAGASGCSGRSRGSSTRSEDMLALAHSRAQVQYVELGCRNDGTFTGLRVRLVGDGGAYPGLGAFLPAGTRRMSNGTYAFPAIQFDIAVAATNTTPTGAYRGAGRPEATALLERASTRRRSRSASTRSRSAAATCSPTTCSRSPRSPASPTTAAPTAHRSTRRPGSPATTTCAASRPSAAARGDRNAARHRRGGVRRDHRRRWQQRVRLGRRCTPTAPPRCMAGTSAHGQGHQTAFAMIVSDQTGIPVDRIRLVQQSTPTSCAPAAAPAARARCSSAARPCCSATEAMVDKARDLAARLLEADPADVVVDTVGRAPSASPACPPARSPGPSWPRAAEREPDAGRPRRRHARPGRAARLRPGRRHVPVRRPHRGGRGRPRHRRVTLLRHIAVDDCGTVLNPLLVEGQQHGGVAAGVSQALYEQVRYDSDGNPLTGNFMDYAHAVGGRVPELRGAQHRDAHAAQPAGREGHRRGEHHRQHAGGAERGHRRASPTSACATSTCRAPASGCGSAIRDAEAGTLPDPWREPPPVFARLAAGQAVDEAGCSAAEGI